MAFKMRGFSGFKQGENVAVDAEDTSEVSEKRAKTTGKFKSTIITTNLDTGTTTELTTREKTKSKSKGGTTKTKTKSKEKFKETDASGKTITKEVRKTNKRGVTRTRGYTTDESGKKQRYRNKT